MSINLIFQSVKPSEPITEDLHFRKCCNFVLQFTVRKHMRYGLYHQGIPMRYELSIFYSALMRLEWLMTYTEHKNDSAGQI